LLAEERWQEGAAALRAWIDGGEPPSALAYYLLAVANYQLQRYEAAVGPAQKAVELSERPPEGWLQLLVALRLERHEYEQALGPLRRLAALAPDKKTYWLQLSSVYGLLGRTQDALVPLQLAHAAGLLTEGSELERLADLLAASGVPYHAARLLERSLADQRLEGRAQDWEKLATTWMAAREHEKAVEPLSRAAALSTSGELYLRLGELHLQLEQWPKAAEALARALDRGGLSSPGDASLLLGIALYRQRKLEDARTSFQRAAASEKVSAQARDWLGFIARDAAQRGP
jgi:tetratricopeptide (TPR) repeat protein